MPNEISNEVDRSINLKLVISFKILETNFLKKTDHRCQRDLATFKQFNQLENRKLRLRFNEVTNCVT